MILGDALYVLGARQRAEVNEHLPSQTRQVQLTRDVAGLVPEVQLTRHVTYDLQKEVVTAIRRQSLASSTSALRRRPNRKSNPGLDEHAQSGAGSRVRQ